MGTFPLAVTPALALQAATPVTGFPLADATPTIISWTPPADGRQHRIMAIFNADITVTAVGGTVDLQFTDLTGTFQSRQLLAPGGAAGFGAVLAPAYFLVQGGQTVYVAQGTALTAGAVQCWAEIWGS